MKQDDVIVGGTYYTNIGAQLCAVVVVAKLETSDWRTGRKKIAFRVRRANETAWLPKLRSAASLREKNERFF